MNHLGQFILNHWMLWLAFVLILVTIFIHELIMQKKQAKSISPATAVDLINHEDAIIVDLRDANAFRRGHIINAIRASDDDVSQRRLEKHKTKPMILVCAKGLESATLAATWRAKGFTQVMVLAGGMAAWQTAALPLIKEK